MSAVSDSASGGSSIPRADAVRGAAAELAEVAGVQVDADLGLARFSTLRIGGPAELLLRIEREDAVAPVLGILARWGLELTILGQGANVLIPDDGLRGAVCRMAGELERIELGPTWARAGASVSLAKLARKAARRGLAGLEALAGFPASVGGAVVMNAGCYGVEVKDVLIEAVGIERDGRRRVFRVADLAPGYRRTALQGSGTVVVEATFALSPGEPAVIEARMLELNRKRWASLPSGRPNAGSVFTNPSGEHAGRLIDQAGIKGSRRGGAAISERHGNVIVNLGDARAADVLELMLLAYRTVRERFGVELEPELQLLGGLKAEWRRRTAE